MSPLWRRIGRKLGGPLHCACFRMEGKKIKDLAQFDQIIKSSFMYTSLDWARVYIDDRYRLYRLFEL